MNLAWRGVAAARTLGLVLCVALFDGACSSDDGEAGDRGDQVSQDGGVPGDNDGSSPVDCEYAGQTYSIGDTFPSDDGCNTCSCVSDGRVACTERACVGPPDGGGFETCEELQQAIDEELASLQTCASADECGQVLTGTSCGCTRAPVARLDADPSRLEALLSSTLVGGVSCSWPGTTCDCPEADGFVCSEGRCAWNYVETGGGVCIDTNPAMICVRGTSGQAGEVLSVGDPLEVTVYPSGCWSSSCTRAEVSECSVTGAGPFVVDASFCLAGPDNPNVGCTADCNGGGFAECASGTTLVAGEHTVTLGTLSVTVTVPSTLPFGGECDGSPF